MNRLSTLACSYRAVTDTDTATVVASLIVKYENFTRDIIIHNKTCNAHVPEFGVMCACQQLSTDNNKYCLYTR